ncbi:hypothetical protein K439DRAFT_1159353 [Ramaria rubella]|nr:hypothetical protein K439DRAFT_1159353 [Ramaria rubella]
MHLALHTMPGSRWRNSPLAASCDFITSGRVQHPPHTLTPYRATIHHFKLIHPIHKHLVHHLMYRTQWTTVFSSITLALTLLSAGASISTTEAVPGTCQTRTATLDIGRHNITVTTKSCPSPASEDTLVPLSPLLWPEKRQSTVTNVCGKPC